MKQTLMRRIKMKLQVINRMVMAMVAIFATVAIIACKSNRNTEMTYKDIEPGVEAGLSGSFAGAASDSLIFIVGGCNFPEDPLGANSKKRFYKGIYLVNPTDESWRYCGALPHEIAYGVSATTPEGTFIAGGSDASQSFKEAYMLRFEDGKPVLTELPQLHVAIDNAYAAAIGSKVYIAGGNNDGKPSRALYMLDLADAGARWSKVSEMPGNPRVQPVMAAAKDAEGNDCLWIWGGFAGRHEGYDEPTLELTGLCYNPQNNSWSELPALLDDKGEAVSVGGGCAATLSDGRIAIAGGVNKDIFIEALRNQAPDYLQHPVEWYRFNGCLIVFDPKTLTCSAEPCQPDLARAGASMVSLSDNRVAVSGGELKPRIRTPKTLLLSL